MYRQNLMRTLGRLIWVAVPAISAMLLLLPRQAPLERVTALSFLAAIMLVNSVTLLPLYEEKVSSRRFGLLMALYSLSVIALTCAAIHFSGGERSPLFPFLVLFTAFSTSLFNSLRAAVSVSLVSVAAYLATVVGFSRPASGDIQLISAQVFFLLLIAFLINRLGTESREQARERARAVEELRSLSEMDRAASSFVSAVSFEMRTPLTSILGFSEMLVSKPLEADKEREYVQIISKEAGNLSRLVEDLLDISRLESGKKQLNKEPTDLGHLIKASSRLLEQACDPSRIALNIPPDLPRVMVDPQRMKRVFDGVFGYIARRSGRGSEVRASVKSEGSETVITINVRNRDTAALARNGSRIFPPLGLPDEEDLELAMARRIVLAHQGRINLIPTSGGWFTIVLRLPQPAPPHTVEAPVSSGARE